MNGHVYKRAQGTWTIMYDLSPDPVTGKRRQKSQTVKGTKRDAERTLRETLTSLEQGTYIKPSKITLGEWLHQWCESYAAMNTSDRTYISYRSVLDNHLIPGLGSIHLSSLEPQQIQNYYAKQLTEGRSDGKGGLSPRSVLYHHRILSKALDHAIRMGVVARNVAQLVSPPRVSKKTMNILTAEQALKFLDLASETVYYSYFATLLFTGMRRGEGLALQWKHIDLAGHKIRVVGTAYKIGQQIIVKEPKTPHSRRAIPLSTSLVELLKTHREEQQWFRKEMDSALSGEDVVFVWPDGRPFDPDSVTHAFVKIVREAGLNVRLHDLRHTYASLMLLAGVHIKVVSEILGHANIAITLDTYSHVLPGLQEDAVEKFDRVFDSVANENNDGSVSKMLASDDGTSGEPHRNRTCNLLIKS